MNAPPAAWYRQSTQAETRAGQGSTAKTLVHLAVQNILSLHAPVSLENTIFREVTRRIQLEKPEGKNRVGNECANNGNSDATVKKSSAPHFRDAQSKQQHAERDRQEEATAPRERAR